MNRLCMLVTVVLCLLLSASAYAVPPEGNGLAASYPGDVGIENDPSVIWVEQFEESTIADLCARYNDVMGQPSMTFSGDKPAGSPGSKSWCITHTNPNPGAHLFKTFSTGYDQLYVRFYVKFAPTSEMPHHFIWLGGQNPPLSYPDPHAGECPTGSDRFSAGFEPNGCSCPEGYIWRWEFYHYWMGMKQSPDNKYWGNIFMWMDTSNPDWPVPKDQWICVEGMVKLNNPVTTANGETGMWIDGSLLRRDGQIISYLGPGTPNGYWTWAMFTPDPASSGFEGFQWRNTTALKLTYLWLEDYLDDAIVAGADVWIDHVVVATQYIGPMVTGPAPPVANFTGNPTSGLAPLTVNFTDTSTGNPTAWSWTFGDGGTSAIQNPSHIYAAGTYTVSLTATNAYGSDGETKTNYISAVTPQDYTCASLTRNTGTILSGDHTSVHTSDNTYLVVHSAKSSGKQTAQISYTFTTGLASLSYLLATVEGKVSAGSQPVTLYAYNYSTSSWTSIATGTFTTTDSTLTPTVTNPAQYISSGTVQVRVKVGGSGNTAFDNSTDLVKITAAP